MPDQRGRRYTSAQREDILERFRESGLSASRFCKEASLSYPTLKRWLGPGETEPMSFVEVESPAPPARRFAVALGDGLWLEFPLDADRSVVAAWIRDLKAC